MSAPRAIAVSSLNEQSVMAEFDAAIVISDVIETSNLGTLANVLEQYKALDARTGKECIFLGAPEVPGNRLIHSPTGSLTRYVDDVRRVFDAAHKAATVALNAGAKKPLLLVSLSSSDSKYQNAIQAAYLGMAQALWQPLEAREALEEAERPKEIK